MKAMLILVMLGGLLAGCSSTSMTQAVSRGNRGIASVAPEGRFPEQAVTSSPGEVMMTVNPSPIVVVPIQVQTPQAASTPAPDALHAWQNYTSAAFGVSVAYPPYWSVTENTGEVIFTSPQGAIIQLQAVSAGSSDETRIGNQRCTTRTNANNLEAEVCVDSISFSYSARFTSLKVALITTTRTVGTIFESMFNSLRPAQ